ncbi:MAG: HEPN domain-containing protein [Gammaproteobacteria bacterium]|nr:HEPN domain-containing protein [Gammaproteobacteria bacterium]
MPTKQSTPTETDRAEIVLTQAKSSIKHFREAFATVRMARKASGPPTAGEQDLIRASLTFAAAGLDSILKELIKGSIKALAEKDTDVQKGLEEYARRQLREETDGSFAKNSANFIAKLLVSPKPYEQLVENYTIHLTGSSLQSVDQLFKASSALGITIKIVNDKSKELREIFEIRNKIIHELDVRFDITHGQKSRNSRTKKGLDEMSDLLLKVAAEYIKAVNQKLIKAAEK